MFDYERVARLRALVLELEQAVPSEQRDALLRRARDRLFALELGEQEPSGWPLHGQGWSSSPQRRGRLRPVFTDTAELGLDEQSTASRPKREREGLTATHPNEPPTRANPTRYGHGRTRRA